MAISVTVPGRLVAGDSLSLLLEQEAADYPSAAGWTLSMVLVLNAGGDPVTVAGSASASGWLLLLNSAASAALTAGQWRWAIFATLAGQRTTLDSGLMDVVPDPITADVDARSHAQKVLAAVEATIEGRASSSQLEVEFEDGRRIKHLDHDQLLKMRDVYAKKVAGEVQRRSGPKKVLARL